ncbi:unannotated protein [freshwater metagenome]
MGEIEEQLLDFVQHFLGAGVLAIYFVDHQDDRQVKGQSLRKHITRLRQWALCGIDQQQNAVNQR